MLCELVMNVHVHVRVHVVVICELVMSECVRCEVVTSVLVMAVTSCDRVRRN